MKLNKILYGVSLAALIVVAGTSCRKDQFNINQNVNNPTDSTVTYDVVLPAALHATGGIVANQWGPIQNWMGYWARSGTYAPNVIEETYEITTGFGNGIWNACYDNNYDYQIIINKAAQAGATIYEGIARIMKAHNFQMLVDVYGNVPYSQALKAGGNPTPSYDNGLDIYKDLLREIRKGDSLINVSVVSTTNANKNISTNDIMFGGDKGKWRRFANTLRLRLLLHTYALSDVTIGRSAEIANILGNGGGFLGAGEDAQVQPVYAADKPNPFFNNYKSNVQGAQTANNVYYRANDWGIEYYKWDGDPRVSQQRTYEAGLGGLIGVAYGLPPITANNSANLAGIGPGVYKTNLAPQCIFSAAESFFLQAEARQRNIITSGLSAQTLMETGVVESMRYLGVTNPSSAAATYFSNNAGYPDVDYTATNLFTGTAPGGLFTIITQKWFALNGINTLEVWTDYRRVPYTEVATTVWNGGGTNSRPAPTDRFVYGDGGAFRPGPTISVAPQNTSTKIPVRYLYPQTEYNYNSANVGAQGTIDRYTKIFWDLQ